jgi:hypothetical protein
MDNSGTAVTNRVPPLGEIGQLRLDLLGNMGLVDAPG